MDFSDGTGGCDGCLNWKGVGARVPNNNDPADFYQFPPVNETDNNGLENLVMALEMIYTNIDWPFEVMLELSFPSMKYNLCDRRQVCQPASSSWASLGLTSGSLLALWPWRGHWREQTGPVTWTTGPGSR